MIRIIDMKAFIIKFMFFFFLLSINNQIFAQNCGCFAGNKMIKCPDDNLILSAAKLAVNNIKGGGFSPHGPESRPADYSNPRIYKYNVVKKFYDENGNEIEGRENKATVFFNVTRFYEEYVYKGGSISIGETGGESSSGNNVKKELTIYTGVTYVDIGWNESGEVISGGTVDAMFEDENRFTPPLIKTGPTSAEFDPCSDYKTFSGDIIKRDDGCQPGWCSSPQKSEISGKVRLITAECLGHDPFVQKIVIVPEKEVDRNWFANIKVNLNFYTIKRNQYIFTPALVANETIYDLSETDPLELIPDEKGEILIEFLPNLGMIAQASYVPGLGGELINTPSYDEPLKFQYSVDVKFPDNTSVNAEKELEIKHIATITKISVRLPDVTNGIQVISNERKYDIGDSFLDPGGKLRPNQFNSTIIRGQERVRFASSFTQDQLDPNLPTGSVLKVGQKLVPGDVVYVNAVGLNAPPPHERPGMMFDGFINVHIRFIDGLEGIFQMKGREDSWATGKFKLNCTAEKTGFEPGYIQAINGLGEFIFDDRVVDEAKEIAIKSGIWVFRKASGTKIAKRFILSRFLTKGGELIFKSALTVHNIHDKMEKIEKLYDAIKWSSGGNGQFIVLNSEVMIVETNYGLQVSTLEGNPLVYNNLNPNGIAIPMSQTGIFQKDGKHFIQPTPAEVEKFIAQQVSNLDSMNLNLQFNDNELNENEPNSIFPNSNADFSFSFWIGSIVALLIHFLVFATKNTKAIIGLLLLDVILYYFIFKA